MGRGGRKRLPEPRHHQTPHHRPTTPSQPCCRYRWELLTRHTLSQGTVTDPSDNTDKLVVASEYRSSDDTHLRPAGCPRHHLLALDGTCLTRRLLWWIRARAFRNEWRRATGTLWSADNTVLTGISDLGTLSPVTYYLWTSPSPRYLRANWLTTAGIRGRRSVGRINL